MDPLGSNPPACLPGFYKCYHTDNWKGQRTLTSVVCLSYLTSLTLYFRIQTLRVDMFMWSDEVNAFNQDPQNGGHPSGLTHSTNLNLSVCTYRTHLSRKPNNNESSNSALASSPHSRKQDLHALLGNPQPPGQAHPASELPLLTFCKSLLPKIPWKIASLLVSIELPRNPWVVFP